MSVAAQMAVVVAAGCALMWVLLATSFARRTPGGSRSRAGGAATFLIGPIFVVLEVWSLAFAVGRSSPSLPWVIAGSGALALAVLVPLMATQTLRLLPDVRRRAVTNIAAIIVMCTLIGELFVFVDAPWARTVMLLSSLFLLVWSFLQRRKSRAG